MKSICPNCGSNNIEESSHIVWIYPRIWVEYECKNCNTVFALKESENNE